MVTLLESKDKAFDLEYLEQINLSKSFWFPDFSDI